MFLLFEIGGGMLADVLLISAPKITEKTFQKCRAFIDKNQKEGKTVYWSPFDELDKDLLLVRAVKELAVCWTHYDGFDTNFVLGLGAFLFTAKHFKKSIKVVNPEDIVQSCGDAGPETNKIAKMLYDINWQNCLGAARRAMARSMCGRGRVGAVIVKNGHIKSTGFNFCQAFTKDNKCKRIHCQRGEKQQLCGTVHAEIAATLNIRRQRSPKDYERCRMPLTPSLQVTHSLFSPMERAALRGSTLIFSGHSYCCDVCREWCGLLGIEIYGDPLYKTA